jgi:uncharacterized protein (DUF488 family)
MTQDPIYSIGHSTRPIEEFIAMLKARDIRTLADIRTIPRSRHNPQFEQDALAGALAGAGMEYRYLKGLGGLRHARPDSPNGGWRNKSFRGYADYMQTEEFRKNLSGLIALGRESRTAMMCAEAVPWRCHRSLVADALVIRHIPVMHIMAEGKASPHKLTPFAQITGETILYPPETQELPGLAAGQG